MLLQGGIVYQNHQFHKNLDISTEGGRFSSGSSDGQVLDCTGLYVLPGLIDIHTHGAMGYDALDGTAEAMDAISRHMLRHGVTAFLPTVMTASHPDMCKAIQVIRDFPGSDLNADMPGVYMEGPYFSQARAGAQNPEHIREISLTEFADILHSGFVKIISIAPEKPGSKDFIEAFKDCVHIAAGHTDANYAEMEQAKAQGITVLTHTFNGMRSLHHRDPGAVGAALDSQVYCEFICDGLHLSPAIIRMLFRQCPERLVMISDSIRPAGLPDGEYTSGGLDVTLSGGIARLKSGTIAGSATNLLEGLRNMVKFGIDLEAAVKTATENPARAAGIFADYGSIEHGKVANAIVLDPDLNLRYVIHRGHCVYTG